MDIGVIRRDGRADAFFDAAAQDRLLLRRCSPCERWYAPDASSCVACGAEGLAWADASGRATLVSWAVAHPRGAGPRAGGDAGEPAVLALVELAEGPWMYGRLPARALAVARVGLALVAEFAHPAEGESFPVFVPAVSP
jgi:uncharacterized protein